MSVSLKKLLDHSELKHNTAKLSVNQLETVYSHLLALIEERKEQQQATELQRKGERALQDMRGLMARAGISMSEFQDTLDNLW